MKRILLFAIILPGIAVAAPGYQPQASPGAVRGHGNRTVAVSRTHAGVRGDPPAPMADTPPEVEGVLPRLVRAAQPIEMVNPFAPSQYGSARNLVVYTEHDNINTNQNANRLQPEGIRFLTIRPIW